MNPALSPGQCIPILNYHTVSAAPAAAIAPFAVRPDDLARHLDLVWAGGLTAVTISDLVDLLDRDGAVAPGTVAITFDDGFEDNLTIAAPLLAARNLPATVYVTSGFLAGGEGTPYPPPGPMLAWDGMRALEAAGIEVGSHAHSHRPLDVLTHLEARHEIRLSKQLIEEALGHRVRSFAYPHGYASRWIENEVRQCGFDSACGVGNAFSHPADNHWHLARLTVGATTTIGEVNGWLHGSCAAVAGPREQLRTTLWRGVRRAGAVRNRMEARLFAPPALRP
jgi:peptidoglycan/xylan/chitin deacetylase (PgdA/CDA1 family)